MNSRLDASDSAARVPLLPGPDLSVVIPTFNERDNIEPLIDSIKAALDGIHWEAIFVDDNSPDGTFERIREFAAYDHRIRVIKRIGRRGLSSACVEGMLSSSARYFAVIDADLQHDERLLPVMMEELKKAEVDIVVASRYADGGDIGDWHETRARMSAFAIRLSRVLVPRELTDPMSGFFMMHRAVFERAVHKLSGIGFKILADLFASSPEPLKFKELPFKFRTRTAGESKLDSVTGWDYGMLLLDKLVGHVIPVRFVAFSIVGAIGVAVHFAVLTIALRLLHTQFVTSQGIAALCTMIFNFALNNVLTYRDSRLRGIKWLRGCASFVLACSIGGFMNLGVSKIVFESQHTVYLAALAGIFVGAIWNYAVTSLLTWGRSGT
jgi:dolichol-phosphate mannosyltransferase